MDIINIINEHLASLLLENNATITHIQLTGSSLFMPENTSDLDYIVILSNLATVSSIPKYHYVDRFFSNELNSKIDLFVYSLESFISQYDLNDEEFEKAARKLFIYPYFNFSNREENIVYGGQININYNLLGSESSYRFLLNKFWNEQLKFANKDHKARKMLGIMAIALDCFKNHSLEPSEYAKKLFSDIHNEIYSLQEVIIIFNEKYNANFN